MISSAFAQREWRPSTQCKIILIIHREFHAVIVRLLFVHIEFARLAQVGNAAFRAVHHQSVFFHIQINVHFLTLTVQQLETCPLRRARSNIHRKFVCSVCIGNQLLQPALAIYSQTTHFAHPFTQRLRFLHRIGSHIYLSVLCIKAQFAGQRVGTAVLFGRKDIGILPIAHPGHGNRTFSRIRKTNGSIMVLTKVQPFGHFGLCVTLKLFAVKVTDKILCSATAKHTPRIDIDNQCPLHTVPVTVHRQLHKVGTLKLAGLYSVTFAEAAHKLPVLQVLRRIETHLLVGRYHHHPFLIGFIPKDLRITEVLQSVKRSQNRILLVFGIRTSIVCAVCHTLNLAVLVTGRSIESNHCIFTVACAVLCIHHCTSREDMP